MTNEIIKNLNEFKMTRYEDLPNFDLYVDQLIQIAEKELMPFSIISNNQKITPSMVNNYVKNQVMEKPIKKKYNKNQLATLIVISALKSVFSIDEIDRAIQSILINNDFESSYNKFCTYLEISLREIFLNENNNIEVDKKDPIYIIVNSISSKLYIQVQLESLRGEDNE